MMLKNSHLLFGVNTIYTLSKNKHHHKFLRNQLSKIRVTRIYCILENLKNKIFFKSGTVKSEFRPQCGVVTCVCGIHKTGFCYDT